MNAPSRAGSGSDGTLAAARGLLTFNRLKWVSLTHSLIYLSLLVSAFAAGGPEPLTAVLGWAHGLLWIGMSLACLAAYRLRAIPLRAAVAVAVLGGVGPFFGSYEFIREQRRRSGDNRGSSAR
ncbi:MAG TPA: hypothetical protein VGX51_13135 [Solirubrobacteraceae bacterium]|nr:hypothetical protein [Solirubrobacteraceae bacterium]